MELTIRELSEIIKIQYPTLKTYLSNYRFSRYIVKSGRTTKIVFNNKFIDVFEEYVDIKRKSGKINKMISEAKPIDRLRLALKRCVA